MKSIPQTLLHSTVMRDAISILSSGELRLAPIEGHSLFQISFARSQLSSFFQDYKGPGQVILVFDKTTLSHNYKIRPYSDSDAKFEIDNDYNEMEERLISSKPILPIRPPINKTIIRIIVTVGDTSGKGTLQYTPEMLNELVELCKRHKIPLSF